MKYVITGMVHPEYPELRRICRLGPDGERNQQYGGWVEEERNLSQEGTCWIADEAIARGGTRVMHNAQLQESAQAVGCTLTDQVYVGGRAYVRGAHLSGQFRVQSMAHLENVRIDGSYAIYDSAWIMGPRDWMQVGPIGSENRMAVLHRSFEDGTGYEVRAGCWRGTVNELRERVFPEADGDSIWGDSRPPSQAHAREYLAWCDLMEIRIKSWGLEDQVIATCDSGEWKAELKRLRDAGLKATARQWKVLV